MKAPAKVFLAGIVVIGAVGWLMATGISETGVYFLTPSELAQRVEADPSFRNIGVKMGANVVRGTITREVATQTITFRVTDGQTEWPVVYRGLAPDTFTDDVEVVVEGRLDDGGVFQATTLLAKCGSRYEAVPEAP
ncbi:MAG: cytochrome c maturation protein CcmE [Gemmatimonadales bacterium]